MTLEDLDRLSAIIEKQNDEINMLIKQKKYLQSKLREKYEQKESKKEKE